MEPIFSNPQAVQYHYKNHKDLMGNIWSHDSHDK